jgi:serine/threonine-protein kinase
VLYCSGRERLKAIAAEASRAARLSHSGIAHVLDLGVHGETSYVATERVVGTTLRAALLRHGRLPWRDVARAVSEAALALAYAHGRRGDDGRLLGIVHGRVSPGRITIEPGGNARISGLGVSWAWPDHLGFGAPEEIRGEPVDGRADVFALGTILVRCTDEMTLPTPVARLVAQATHELPEHRCTAAQLHDALTLVLRDAEPAAAD